MPSTSNFQLHYCFVECSHFAWWHGRTTSMGIFRKVCLVTFSTKISTKVLFLIEESVDEVDELGRSSSSRFFASRSSFSLLYFDPQVLWKHAWSFFKDSYKFDEFARFPFSSTVSVIAFQSRSSSPRFLYSVMLFATVYNVSSVSIISFFCLFWQMKQYFQSTLTRRSFTFRFITTEL